MSEEDLEIFLDDGLPKMSENDEDKFEQPLNFTEYYSRPDKVQSCIEEIDRRTEQVTELSTERWPLLAVLFAHEHLDSPSTKPDICSKAKKILNRIHLSEEIIQRVFQFVASRLTRDRWKFYFGERYILISITKRHPNIIEQMPFVLRICDSVGPQGQLIGLECISNMLTDNSEDESNRCEVILDLLTKFTFRDDLEVLDSTWKNIEKLLFDVNRCETQQSKVYLNLLQRCAMSIEQEQKSFYAATLLRFVKRMKFAVRQYLNMTLDVIEHWTEYSVHREAGLLILRELLQSGIITHSWKRAAKILLTVSVKDPKESERNLILQCRSALLPIRKEAESPPELEVFRLISASS